MKFIITLTLLLFGNFVTAQAITIGQRISFESKILEQQREFLIYTPPSYGFSEQEKFPVLYIIDADYNFHYVTGLIELLSSISNNIPEMIVIGISAKGTTTYRKQSKPPFKTNDKGIADVTMNFIEKEVIPFIDARYQTNSYRVLAGHSIGGLFTTYGMLHHNHVFDTFISISPSLWWEDEKVKAHTQEYFKKKPELKANYYITLADEKAMGVHGFVEMMEYKAPKTFTMKFKHFPNQTHGSVGLPSYRWSLEDLYKDFKPKGDKFLNAQAVEDYYHLIKEKYKTVFHLSAGHIRSTVYAHFKDGQKSRAIEEMFEKYFPNQVDEYRNIFVEALISKDMLKQAEEILVRAIKNNPKDFVTLTNQSRLYLKQNKKDKALKTIDKALINARKINIRQWLLNELLEQKQMLKN